MRFCSLTHLLEELREREATRKIVVLGSSSLLEPVDKEIALRLGQELGKISVDDLRKRWSSMPLGEREMFQSGRNLALIVEGSGSR
jgi:hypothetical protein